MRERILFSLMAGLVVAATWWVWIADPGRIPILDYNRQVLAETEVEGFCAGATFWETRGAGSASKAQKCRAANPDMSTEIDHPIVIKSFCLGAASVPQGYDGSLTDGCEEPLKAQSYWPTMDGRLTQAFDELKGYPYPGDSGVFSPPSDSRTGTRDGFSRDDEPEETTTTTTEETTTTTGGGG